MLELKREFGIDYKGGEYKALRKESIELTKEIISLFQKSGVRLGDAFEVLEDVRRALLMASNHISARKIAGMLDIENCPHSEEQGRDD